MSIVNQLQNNFHSNNTTKNQNLFIIQQKIFT